MTKQELRELYSDKRKKLTEVECARFNLELYNHFFSFIDLSFIKILHTYLPIVKNKEPDTWMITDRVRREFPQVRISIPRVGAGKRLDNFYFESMHQLQTNAWGIQEPQQGVPTPIEKIDLVIVPLLVVDHHGHRVGYGQGYYDHFLKECRDDCKKIGLSFFESVDKITDLNSSDVSLNACITPEQVLNFDALS